MMQQERNILLLKVPNKAIEGTDYIRDRMLEITFEAVGIARVWESEFDEFDTYDYFKDSDYEVDIVRQERLKTERKIDPDTGKLFVDKYKSHTYSARCDKCGNLCNPLLTSATLPGWRYLTFECSIHGIWYEKVKGGMK